MPVTSSVKTNLQHKSASLSMWGHSYSKSFEVHAIAKPVLTGDINELRHMLDEVPVSEWSKPTDIKGTPATTIERIEDRTKDKQYDKQYARSPQHAALAMFILSPTNTTYRDIYLLLQEDKYQQKLDQYHEATGIEPPPTDASSTDSLIETLVRDEQLQETAKFNLSSVSGVAKTGNQEENNDTNESAQQANNFSR